MYNKIEKYLLDNNINIKNVDSYFEISDNSDNNGAFIKSWDSKKIGIEQPTQRQLDNIDEKKIKLEKLKEAKTLEAKAKRNKDLSKDVEVEQGTFQHSTTSDINLIAYKECLEIDCKDMISWKLKNNIKVKLTTKIINDWLKVIAKQRSQVYQDYFDLKQKINNAKTISTLNKIEIK